MTVPPNDPGPCWRRPEQSRFHEVSQEHVLLERSYPGAGIDIAFVTGDSDRISAAIELEIHNMALLGDEPEDVRTEFEPYNPHSIYLLAFATGRERAPESVLGMVRLIPHIESQNADAATLGNKTLKDLAIIDEGCLAVTEASAKRMREYERRLLESQRTHIGGAGLPAEHPDPGKVIDVATLATTASKGFKRPLIANTLIAGMAYYLLEEYAKGKLVLATSFNNERSHKYFVNELGYPFEPLFGRGPMRYATVSDRASMTAQPAFITMHAAAIAVAGRRTIHLREVFRDTERHLRVLASTNPELGAVLAGHEISRAILPVAEHPQLRRKPEDGQNAEEPVAQRPEAGASHDPAAPWPNDESEPASHPHSWFLRERLISRGRVALTVGAVKAWSNVGYVAEIAAGNTAIHYGVNPVLAAAATTLGVTAETYWMSKVAQRGIGDYTYEPRFRLTRAIKRQAAAHPAASYAISVWNGAPTGVILDQILGRPVTRRRRLMHSLPYGLGVGFLWTGAPHIPALRGIESVLAREAHEVFTEAMAHAGATVGRVLVLAAVAALGAGMRLHVRKDRGTREESAESRRP